jgi:hypothetical protein
MPLSASFQEGSTAWEGHVVVPALPNKRRDDRMRNSQQGLLLRRHTLCADGRTEKQTKDQPSPALSIQSHRATRR